MRAGWYRVGWVCVAIVAVMAVIAIVDLQAQVRELRLQDQKVREAIINGSTLDGEVSSLLADQLEEIKQLRKQLASRP